VVVMVIATLVGLAGIGAGYMLYRNAFATADALDPLEQMMPGVFKALNQRLYIDQFYGATVGTFAYTLALVWRWFDRRVLNGLLNGTGALTMFLGRLNFIIDDTVLNDGVDALSDGTNLMGDATRQVETGKIQDYASLIFMGVVVLGVIYLYGFGQ